jgi:hypothetical protein
MKHSEELYTLLSETVIPEVEGFMKTMATFMRENETTEEMLKDQEGIRAIHQNFLDIMGAIEAGEIEEENCAKLIEEITMLRTMGNQIEP